LAEDTLIGLILDRMPVERRLKWIAQLGLQFFLNSSTNVSLFDQFALLSTRLRAVPALFAVVDEAQQPIKICDDQNVVQYVNRYYSPGAQSMFIVYSMYIGPMSSARETVGKRCSVPRVPNSSQAISTPLLRRTLPPCLLPSAAEELSPGQTGRRLRCPSSPLPR
jgi:hypothetical protein